MRLLHKEDIETTQKYRQIINALQEIAESHRDIIMRSFTHIDNNHKGLLKEQINELNDIWENLSLLLDNAIEVLLKNKFTEYGHLEDMNDKINKSVKEYDKMQILRIQEETSKTRLSILYYGKMGDFKKIANNTLKLMEVFNESFNFMQVKESEYSSEETMDTIEGNTR